MYRVVLTRRAEKGLAKSPKQIQEKTAIATEALQNSFAPSKMFDVKRLKGLENTYRIRIGGWRLIYEFQKKEGIIIVHDIIPRKKAYK